MGKIKDTIKNNVFISVVTGAVIVLGATGGIYAATNNSSDSVSQESTIEATTQETTQEATTVQETTTVVQETTQAVAQLATSQAIVEQTTTSAPVIDDATKYFRFSLINDTYTLTALNYYSDMPSTIVVPSSYQGVPVTGIGSGVLDGMPVSVFVIPSTITSIDNNLCGVNAGCASLTAIVCTGSSPFSLGSLSLNQSQLSGDCSIYIPDSSIEDYKAKWNTDSLRGCYDALMKPLSQCPYSY